MPLRKNAFLGCGVGLRSAHYRDFLRERQSVDWLEVHTENYLHEGGLDRYALLTLRADYAISLHGVGLGLGSVHGFDVTHARRIAELVRAIEPALVSEHLCWSAVTDRHMNDLLPLTLSHEALDLVCERVDRLQNMLRRQVLLENVSTYLRYREDGFGETEFLVEVAQRTGCGILLDVNNLYVNQCNHQESALQAMDCIPEHLVGEIHLAGHLSSPDAVVDDHGDVVAEPVWELYRAALARFGAISTLVEWDTNVPALPMLLGEAAKVRIELQTAGFLATETVSASPPICRAAGHYGQAFLFAARTEQPNTAPIAGAMRTSQPEVPLDTVIAPLSITQETFAHGLFEGGTPQIFAGDPGLVQTRFARYRGHLASHWEKSLVATYPVLQQLVGPEFFSGLCRAYGHAYPSISGDLTDFGARFPQFLEEFPHVAQYPYFPDVARLEYAISSARHAQDGVGLSAAHLAELPPEEFSEARFTLRPSCALLFSPWAVAGIWQAHQKDANAAEPPEVELPERLQEDCYALVYREVWKPRVLELAHASHALLAGITCGQSFGTALEAALALDPEFDLPSLLRQLLTLEVLQPPGNSLRGTRPCKESPTHTLGDVLLAACHA